MYGKELETLQTYRACVIDLEALELQLKRCGTSGRPKTVGGARMDDMPRGTNDPVSALMQQLDGLEEMIARRREEMERLQDTVTSVIATARDWRVQFILLRYYTLAQTDEQIALSLQLSARQVCRLRNGFFSGASSGGRSRQSASANVSERPCMSAGQGV